MGPYRVSKVIPAMSNYKLDLPLELTKRRVHERFHVGLLRPHVPNDDVLLHNRKKADLYDFGAPEDAKWSVNKIVGHKWKGKIPSEIELRRFHMGTSSKLQ
jgi:hypothetical protein